MATEPDLQLFSVTPYDEPGGAAGPGSPDGGGAARIRRVLRSRHGLLGQAWLIPAGLSVIAGFTALYSNVEQIAGSSDGTLDAVTTRFQYTVFATGRIVAVSNQDPVDRSGSNAGQGPLYCVLIWAGAALFALAAVRAAALPHARRLPAARAIGLSASVLLVGFAATLGLELYPPISDGQNHLHPGPAGWLILASVLCAAAIVSAEFRFRPPVQPSAGPEPVIEADPQLTSRVDAWDGPGA